jgi:hypothetical protein
LQLRDHLLQLRNELVALGKLQAQRLDLQLLGCHLQLGRLGSAGIRKQGRDHHGAGGGKAELFHGRNPS